MTQTLRILVLGDSVLSSVGGCHVNALDFFRGVSYDRPLELHNVSAIGMTAADAWAHFKEQTEARQFDAVLLYVGNCDACSFGARKKASRAWAGWVDGLARLWRGRAQRHSTLSPYRYVKPEAQAWRQEAVTPHDFERFVERIVARALRLDMRVFFINAACKADFPPSNTAPNALFYKLVGVRDTFRFDGDGAHDRLIEALRLHQLGRREQSMEAYTGLVQDASDREVRSIATNNKAVLCADHGDAETASAALSALNGREETAAAVAFFNLAVLARRRGAHEEALRLFEDARERDHASYRVRSPYHIASRSSWPDSVRTIDVGATLSDHDFVDYCHPTENGHRKLHGVLERTLAQAYSLAPGPHRPLVSFRAVNPNRALGATGSFFEHFGVVVTPTSDFCTGIVRVAESEAFSALIDEATHDAGVVKRADKTRHIQLRILTHPLFGNPEVLRELPPNLPIDQGRLPELYALRHYLALVRAHEQRSCVRRAFERQSDLLPTPARIARWWSALPTGCEDPERARRVIAQLDASIVLRRVATLLHKILEREPVAYNKYRTTALWFLREAFLFGTTSHYSMFYDRLGLHQGSVSLLCLRLSNDDPEVQMTCDQLMQVIDAIITVHARYLAPHSSCMYALPEHHFHEYQAALRIVQSSEVLVNLRSPS